MRSAISEPMRSLAELMRSAVSELMRSMAELMRSLAELMRSAVSQLMRSLAELMRSLSLVAADLEGNQPAGMSPYHWPPRFTSGSGRDSKRPCPANGRPHQSRVLERTRLHITSDVVFQFGVPKRPRPGTRHPRSSRVPERTRLQITSDTFSQFMESA
ncbi:hypothetical protein Taro_044389 [Colocasia esculenta]|uniref:Uncharacterized protein n=1 Tax=Colocasia esculenta TaxID=4460 RepID=A0A843WJ11_COLES|nr:hypothetical protein [Colocasia esculenta]